MQTTTLLAKQGNLELWQVESVSGNLQWKVKGLRSSQWFGSETVAKGTFNKALNNKGN